MLDVSLLNLLGEVQVGDCLGPGDPDRGVLCQVHHLVLLDLRPRPDLPRVKVKLLLLELSCLLGNGARELDC